MLEHLQVVPDRALGNAELRGELLSRERSLAEERSVAAGKIFQPLRVALTGLTVSPGIFEVLVTMGPELTTKRLKDAYEYLNSTHA